MFRTFTKNSLAEILTAASIVFFSPAVSGQNIGVNTDGSAPSTLFHTKNTIAAQNNYLRIENTQGGQQSALQLLNSGTAGADWIQYIPGGTTALRFYRGADRVTFLASGNVGIGSINPVQALDIVGKANTSAGYNFGNVPVIYNSSTDVYGNIRVLRSESTLGDGMYIGYNGSGGPLRFFSNSGTTELMSLTTAGNLGIGSTSPGAKLEVAGQVKITGGSPGDGRVLMSNSVGLGSWGREGTGQFSSGSVTAGNWYRIASNSGDRANAEFTLRCYISSGGHSTLKFMAGISYNDENNISFTVLNHNIYSTPTFTKVRILEATTYDPQYLEVYCARTGSVDYSIVSNLQSSGWTPVAWTAGSIPGGYNAREFDVDKLFMVGDSDDRFTVARGGNVGIGSVSPAYKLDVYGPSGASPAKVGSPDGYLAFGPVNSGWCHFYTDRGRYYFNTGGTFDSGNIGSYDEDLSLQTSGTTRITVLNSNGNVGVGTTSPAQKLEVSGKIKSNGINETSDIRYKKNIIRIPSALDKTLSLSGVNYYWKKEEYPGKNFDSRLQMGLIAQDVEKIIPEVVLTDPDGYKSVEYSKIVGLLIEAIKEQQKTINELQSAITDLKIENRSEILKIQKELALLKTANAELMTTGFTSKGQLIKR